MSLTKHACMIQRNAHRPVYAHRSNCAHSSRRRRGAAMLIGEFCVIESMSRLVANAFWSPMFTSSVGRPWATERDLVGYGSRNGPSRQEFYRRPQLSSYWQREQGAEHYTISRGTKPESEPRSAMTNYIMTSGHIAHNATLGDNTVVASCALVAGYVEIGDRAFVSGGVVIHQFSRIGA